MYNLYTYTDTYQGEPNFSWAKRCLAKTLEEACEYFEIDKKDFTVEWDAGEESRLNEKNACRCILVEWTTYDDPEMAQELYHCEIADEI